MTDPYAPPNLPELLPPSRDELRGRLGYRLGVLALSVLALVTAALAIGYSFVSAEMYGEPATPVGLDWVLVLVLAGIPGVLLGVAVTLLADLRGRSLPMWATIPVAFAVMWAATAWQADAGARQHEVDDAVISRACSQSEMLVLDALGDYGSEYSGPQGQKNGDCSAWIMVPGDDPKQAMTELGWELGMDGWVLGSGDWRSGVWVRDYVGVRVNHIQSSDGSTGVEFIVVNAT